MAVTHQYQHSVARLLSEGAAERHLDGLESLARDIGTAAARLQPYEYTGTALHVTAVDGGFRYELLDDLGRVEVTRAHALRKLAAHKRRMVAEVQG